MAHDVYLSWCAFNTGNVHVLRCCADHRRPRAGQWVAGCSHVCGQLVWQRKVCVILFIDIAQFLIALLLLKRTRRKIGDRVFPVDACRA